MINSIVNNLSKKLINVRQELHKIPELSFCEIKTSNFICSHLDDLELSYERVLDTGVVCTIKGKKGDGKTILVRADIDALPIKELTDIDFKSQNDGVMHACGHDVHTTIALGLCETLKELDFDFCGNIKVVFQPAEEGDGGAKPMIDNGIMKNPNVDACIALHVEPLSEVGTIQYRNGPIMASPDDFKIEIIGKGGHGACPEDAVNPIYPASVLIQKLQNAVNVNFKNPDECVLSVCTVNAGTFNNIIPESVEITGTARSLTQDVRDKIEKLIEEYIKDVTKQYNCKYNYTYNRLYPPVTNSKEMNELLIASAKKTYQIKEIIELGKSSMTGDDFSYFAELVPSVYFKIGCGNDKINEPLHSSKFNVDENVIKTGVELMTNFCLEYLKK